MPTALSDITSIRTTARRNDLKSNSGSDRKTIHTTLHTNPSVLDDSTINFSSSDTATIQNAITHTDLQIIEDSRHRIIHEQLQALKDLQTTDPQAEKDKIRKSLIEICEKIHNQEVYRFSSLKDGIKVQRNRLLEIDKKLGLAKVVNKQVHTEDILLKQAFRLVDFCDAVINGQEKNPHISILPIENTINFRTNSNSKISQSIEILEGFLTEPPVGESHKHLFENLPLAAIKNKDKEGKHERWFYLGKGQEVDPTKNEKVNGFFFMRPLIISEKKNGVERKREGVEYKFFKQEKLGERPLLLKKDKFEELTNESTNPNLSKFKDLELDYNGEIYKCKVIGKTVSSTNNANVGQYALIRENKKDGTIQILQNIPSNLVKSEIPKTPLKKTNPPLAINTPSTRQPARTPVRTAARTQTPQLVAFSSTKNPVMNFFTTIGKAFSSFLNGALSLFSSKEVSIP